jgi:hypothetical protein
MLRTLPLLLSIAARRDATHTGAVSIDWTIAPRGWQGGRERGFAAGFRRALALLLAACTLLPGCDSTPAEQRLRETIDAMELAVVERRPGDFMESVAADFVGNGNIDRAAVHNLLRAQLLRNAEIGVTRGPLEIELQGERASVRFKLVATGGSGGLLPERAQGYDFKTGWREEDGDWRLFLAEWKPAL